MKRPTSLLFELLIATTLIVGACSKSVEGESRKWDSNSVQLAELSATYPGFRPALEARKAAAAKIHDAAAGLDGDAKIAKLSEANTAMMQGFVGELDALDGQMKKLRESRVEVTTKASEATRLGAKVAAEDAQRALDRADTTLKAGATDETAAVAVLRKLKGDLDTAQSALNKVLEIDKAKQDKTADAKQSEASKKTADDAAAAAKVAPWKCSYCSSENPHDGTACKSCGAPRAEAKPAAK